MKWKPFMALRCMVMLKVMWKYCRKMSWILWQKSIYSSSHLFVLQGYLYSSAVRLVGVEISAEFVRLQNMAVEKYGFSDRIQVKRLLVSFYIYLSWSLFYVFKECKCHSFLSLSHISAGHPWKYQYSGFPVTECRCSHHEQCVWVLSTAQWSNEVGKH